MSKLVECKVCFSEVIESVAYTEIWMLRDPPNQLERYTARHHWQCMAVERHYGFWEEPSDHRGGV